VDVCPQKYENLHKLFDLHETDMWARVLPLEVTVISFFLMPFTAWILCELVGCINYVATLSEKYASMMLICRKYVEETVKRSPMDIKRKTCDI
jgi:hypothetical protein